MNDFGFGYWVGLPLGIIFGAFWGWLITAFFWQRSERKMQDRHAEAIARTLDQFRVPSPRFHPSKPFKHRKVWFDSAGHPHFIDQKTFDRALKAASEKLGEFTRKPPAA